MANTPQAQKRARQAAARNRHNASMRSMMRTSIKRVHQAIDAGDQDAANEVFRKACSIIDRVADKNIIHKKIGRASCRERVKNWFVVGSNIYDSSWICIMRTGIQFAC